MIQEIIAKTLGINQNDIKDTISCSVRQLQFGRAGTGTGTAFCASKRERREKTQLRVEC